MKFLLKQQSPASVNKLFDIRPMKMNIMFLVNHFRNFFIFHYFLIYKKVVTSVHVMQKMKMVPITPFLAGKIFENNKILNCDCCTI